MLVFGISHKSAVLYLILMFYRWEITGLLGYDPASSKFVRKIKEFDNFAYFAMVVMPIIKINEYFS